MMKRQLLILGILFYSISVFSQTTGGSGEVGITEGQLSVSLTGAATYSIPIAVPPGINGVVPQVFLNYNSQAGNGDAGYGWNIAGVSKITRIPSTKIHDEKIDAVDFDNLDRFALDGQRLMLKSSSSGNYISNGNVYETENFSNIKITSSGIHSEGIQYGPLSFKVEYPDGSEAHYGNTLNSRTIFEYAITYWQNPQGIRINYFYNNSNNNLTISEITYGTTYENTGINIIRFNYVPRARPEQAYVGNQNLKKNDILDEIRVIGNGLGFRNYQLTRESTSLGYERLKVITEKTGDDSLSLNPTIFNYDTTNNDNLFSPQGPATLSYMYADYNNTKYISGDFNGDAVTDLIIYPSNRANYHLFTDIASNTLNNSNYQNTPFREIFTTTQLIGDASSGYKLSPRQGWTVIKTDASNTTTFSNYLYDGNVNLQSVKSLLFPKLNFYTQHPLDCNSAGGNVTLDIPVNYLEGDFNGDGLTDIVAVESDVPYPYYTHPCINGSPQFNFNVYEGKAYFINLDKRVVSTLNVSGLFHSDDNSKMMVGEYNGDGKADIYIFREGSIKVYSLNENNYFDLIGTQNDTGIIFDNPILLGDYNGDGKTDFVIPQASGYDAWDFFLSGANETGSGVLFHASMNTIGFAYQLSYYGNFPAYGITPNTTSLNEVSYIANDFNGDGKTDILVQQNLTVVTVHGVTNPDCCVGHPEATLFTLLENRAIPGYPISFYAYDNGPQATGVFKNPIPIFTNHNKVNQQLEYSLLSHNTLYTFNNQKDNREDMLLKQITTGNGVKETITYKPLKTDECGTDCNSVYTNTALTENYPNTDIVIAPWFKVVTLLNKESSTVNKKQMFSYDSAVANVEGLGFLGFRATMSTNWTDESNTGLISTISKNNIGFRGAPIENFSLLGFYLPQIGTPSTGFISKTINTYNIDNITSAFEQPLQTNKVFKLKITKTEQFNGLDDTRTLTTTDFNIFNNPELSKTNVFESTQLQQTTISTITYQDSPSSTPYVVGRPASKNTNIQIFPSADQTNNLEEYTYENSLLTQIKKTENSMDALIEDNIYDDYGNITSKTISIGAATPRTTLYQYDDSHRFLEKSTDIEGLETNFLFNPWSGVLLKETNPYNLETNFTYDKWLKKETVVDYLGNEQRFAYANWSGTSLSMTESDDGSFSYELFDDLGRKTVSGKRLIHGVMSLVETEYDIHDRIVSQSEPRLSSETSQNNLTEYDEYGRIINHTLYTGKTIQYGYAGLITSQFDGQRTKTTKKNALGATVSVQDMPGGLISYTYFANGNVESTNYGGVTTSMEYDGWGRKTKLIDPSAGTYIYEYFPYGELKKEITPNGTTEYVIDDFGKNTDKTIIGTLTDSETTFMYDSDTKLLTSISYTDNLATITTDYLYQYDDYKRLNMSGEMNTEVLFMRMTTFDMFGRPQMELYHSENLLGGEISSKVTKNEYQNGYLHKIIDFTDETILWQLESTTAKGQAIDVGFANNTGSKINTYDGFGYPDTSTFTNLSGPHADARPFMVLTHAFDAPRGLLKTRTNSLFMGPGSTANFIDEAFDYDALDRLTHYPDASGNGLIQAYDDMGRITSNTSGAYEYANSASPYRLSNVELSDTNTIDYYTARDPQEISYNAFKSPVSINEEGVERINFRYGAFNNRSAMYYGNTEVDIDDRTKRRYYSSDGSMEITIDETIPGSPTVELLTYIGGGAYSAPVVAKNNGNDINDNYYYLHRDYQGSILAITDGDGLVVEKRRYDAWGDILEIRDSNDVIVDKFVILDRGYTGHEHLLGVGLINMNARLYDPKLHRFLGPDNYVQAPDNTQSYNRYAYCLNNPFMYTDYSGESWWDDNWKSVVTIVAAVATAVVIVASMGTATPLVVAFWAGAGAGFVGNSLGTALNGGTLGQSLIAGLGGAIMGGAMGYAGAYVSAWVGAVGIVPGALSGSATSTTLGALGNIMSGNDWDNGLALTAAFGAVGGGYGGLSAAKTSGSGIWFGTAAKPSASVIATNINKSIEQAGADFDKAIRSQAQSTSQANTATNGAPPPDLGKYPAGHYDINTQRALPTGQSPFSAHTQTTNLGKPIQTTYYDFEGKAHFQVDFKFHGQGGIHGHQLKVPGSFSRGYNGFHIPYNEIPIFYRP